MTEVPAQTGTEGTAAIATLTGTPDVTDIVIVLEVAVFGEAHGSFEVRSQVTASASARAVLVKVGLPVLTTMPLTFQLYWGDVPPLVGVAVKVTDVPGQIAPTGRADMEMPAGDGAFISTEVEACTCPHPFAAAIV